MGNPSLREVEYSGKTMEEKFKSPAKLPFRKVGLAILLCLTVPGFLVLSLLSTIFFVANGPTLSGFCLATLPFFALFFTAIALNQRWRKAWCFGIAIVFLLIDIAYATSQLIREPSGALRFCENGDCDRSGPLISRIPREDETAYTGLALSSALSLIRGQERDQLGMLLHLSYEKLDRNPHFQGLPNAVLIGSDQKRVRTLVWQPEGSTKLPCLVFLHGFGGQLTIYLEALLDSELGQKTVMVAPYFRSAGDWWSDDRQTIVRRVLEKHLPSRADHKRVYLIGLSNGAIGTAQLWPQDSIQKKLAGAIMLSGSHTPPERGNLQGQRGLVIAGTEDPRFPIAYVEKHARAFEDRGADVTLSTIKGDHFIILSHSKIVTSTIADWLKTGKR